jgi:mycothiol system anti-sigma-R factor
VSCGQPHETDCSEVLDRVYEYVDGELTPEDLHAIRHHLEECAPCLRQYDLEAVLKQLVRRSCQDRAPEGLRVRIMARITEVRITTDG